MARDIGVPETPRPKHRSAEAYSVMRYEGVGGRREWIWNSRDGVTPFTVLSIDGVEMHHGNWHLDRYEPFHIPAVGSRIFVDMTEEFARPKAAQYVERHWDNAELPMSRHPTFSALGKDGAVEHFVRQWISDWGGHSPCVVVVTDAMQALFKARSENRHL